MIVIMLFTTIVHSLKEGNNSLKAVQKPLINSIGERDYSAQETCNLLLQLPMLKASRRLSVRWTDVFVRPSLAMHKNCLVDAPAFSSEISASCAVVLSWWRRASLCSAVSEATLCCTVVLMQLVETGFSLLCSL